MSDITLNRRRFGLLAGAAVSVGARGALAAAPARTPGRPHTDFVQAQNIPTRIHDPKNSKPGARSAVLSYDRATASVSVLFRMPGNWVMDKPYYNDSDEEIFVLAGDMRLDDIEYKAGDYAFLPAGLPRRHMESKGGCAVLTYYEGQHLVHYDPAPAGMYDPSRLIARMPTGDLAWSAPDEAESGRKVLRQDAKTGAITYLLRMNADDRKTTARQFVLPVIEETFLIEGEVATPQGTQKRGAYTWRPAGSQQGPYGCRKDSVSLIRRMGNASGGPEQVKMQTIAWDAPYQPIIPDEFKKWAFNAVDTEKDYYSFAAAAG